MKNEPKSAAKARSHRLRRLLTALAMLVYGGFGLSQARCAHLSGNQGEVVDRGPDETTRSLVEHATAEHLARFDGEEAFMAYLHGLEVAQTREHRRQEELAARRRERYGALDYGEAEEVAEAPAVMESEGSTDDGAETSTEGDGESITNNQEQGVDEGGIVKVHGDHLVVLRRGRLFSIGLGQEALTPISMMDAYPPGAQGGWYDEMLVRGDRIVVVGFNYQHSSTEIGLFRIDSAGVITRQGTFYLRSNDYYSSRNYASRLLGDRLVFYMPYNLLRGSWDGEQYHYGVEMPGVREGEGDWREIMSQSEIYQPIQETPAPVLHTVVTCDLSRPGLSCQAQGILGPGSRSFYVSRSAVYLWVGNPGWGQQGEEAARARQGSVVYRLPLDGSAPGALRAWGMPTDQFSFQERGGDLNVLVRAESGGDGMWSGELSEGDLALLRAPLGLFTDGVASAQRDQYTSLPRPSGPLYAFQNRFVGEHLLYGTGGGWGAPSGASIGVVQVHSLASRQTTSIALPHVVDRIEVMGRDAVVVGSGGGNLHFSAVSLGERPAVAGHHLQPAASQGETRSHGFFYRSLGEDRGVLGLPIRGGSSPGYAHLSRGSAGVLFLDVEQRRFSPLGRLDSQAANTDDHCVASCVDWYGNSRPIFYRGRVFALLGYELVEGRIEQGAIREARRTHFYNQQPTVRGTAQGG